jgi:hypothetical protein
MLLLAAAPAAAVPVVLTDPAANLSAVAAPCSIYPTANNTLPACAVRGFLERTSIAGPDAGFSAAFDNWNLLLPADQRWTLVNGGALPGLTLAVDQFRTEILGIGNNVGRGTIRIRPLMNGVSLDARFYWSQGLYDDYLLTEPFYTTLRYEMDVTNTNPCTQPPGVHPPNMCAPLYPFQYADRRFFDQPVFPMGATFNGWAYISEADFTNRRLTVYDGVRYGWTSTPEPAGWLLTGAGAVLLAILSRQRRLRPGRPTRRSAPAAACPPG